jgi:hypothetical protein
MAMKNSLLVVLLVSIAGVAVGAPLSLDPTSSGRSGSRANRPSANDATPGSPAASLTHPVSPNPLNAEHLATIQGVGRTVLAAKHSTQPDPAVEAMHQQLKAVSAELTKVFREGSTSKPILRLGKKDTSGASSQASRRADAGATLKSDTPTVTRLVPGAEPGTFVEEAVAPSPSRSARAVTAQSTSSATSNSDAWHKDVASLQGRLANARAQLPAGPATAGTRMMDHRLLANKESQLLDEVQLAVNAQDATQLAALRDRMTPRRLPAERARLQAMADPDHQTKSVAPTPTVSTLTKHR